MFAFNNDKKSQGIQRNKNVVPIQGEKNKRKCPWMRPNNMWLSRHIFKSTVLKMLKGLKEDMKRVRKQFVNKIETS